MKTKMSYGGIGPRLALLCLPYIILSVVIMIKYPGFSDIGFMEQASFSILGFAGLGVGLIFWAWSAIYFLKYFKAGALITKGPFSLCRNPLYSSIIVFIIPSLALILHSGLILSFSPVLFLGFKISIHGETIKLKRIFGDEYERYSRSVNEIFPFPGFLNRAGN